jgi:alkylation response protein AidB-like acyl-CoA dehydrogenase
MCGTGSNTVVGNDIFVPRHRLMHLSEAVSYRYPTEHVDEALYRSSFAPTCTLCPSAPIYGMARAALDLTLERLEKTPKKVAYTMVRDTRQMPTTQLALAQASVLIDTAYLHARDVADSLDAVARTGKEMDVADRSRCRMKVGHAMRCAREAVDLLLDVQGASSFALSNPLQRVWRDISAASRHGLLNADNIHSIYGRTILGLPDLTTPLV